MILFGKEIDLKTHHCQLYDYAPTTVENPYVNIQVQLKGCNANCKFCISKNPGHFNEDEYFRKLKLILEQVGHVKKLNFTGGEPTLNFERLERLVHRTRELLPNTYFTLNTNGYNFEKAFDNLYEEFDNIQLSRHHYDDKKNNEILGFRSVSKDFLKEIATSLEDKKFLNVSCNLIKGYIDNENEVFNYLEDCSKMDIRWVGFVTLIPLNDFCNENRVSFEDMNLDNNRFIQTKHWKAPMKSCQCFNYVYVPKDLSDPISVYNKKTEKGVLKYMLVFDGENFNIGFGDDKLI